MSWKKMIMGEKMPDKDDPKVPPDRYEKRSMPVASSQSNKD
jgi:hypothetical protein